MSIKLNHSKGLCIKYIDSVCNPYIWTVLNSIVQAWCSIFYIATVDP